MGTAGEPQKVPVGSSLPAGELWAAQLDVKACMDDTVRDHARPAQVEVILGHAIYQAISTLAGMQELMAIQSIGKAAKQGYDAVVVDTAPSRHALEFLDKPDYFVQLVSSPLVRLVGRYYHWWEKSTLARLGRIGFALYRKVEELVGAQLTRDILEFYSAFIDVAEGYAAEAGRTLEMLRDAEITSFTVVTTPSKARRDGQYFSEELRKRKFYIESLVVNRVWPRLGVKAAGDMTGEAQALVTWYNSVSAAHQKAWAEAGSAYAATIPRVLQMRELATDIDGLPALFQIAQSLDT
jgi:anion-transporting  ArsA/GET3 family ATPase